jgi:hypothetical protein
MLNLHFIKSKLAESRKSLSVSDALEDDYPWVGIRDDLGDLVDEVERLRTRLDEQQAEHIAELHLERDGNTEMMGHVVEVIRHALGFMIDEKPQTAKSILSFALGCYCGEESWDRLVEWLREPNHEEVPGV